MAESTVFDIFYPRRKNLAIFGANWGTKYYDNTRFLFEYFIENSILDPLWVTKSRKVYDYINSIYPNRVIINNSFVERHILLSARLFFVTHGYYDFNIFRYTKRKNPIINLWHGIFLKKFGIHTIGKREVTGSDYVGRYSDVFLASSEYEAEIISESFSMDIKDIWVTGYPRNDILVNNNSSRKLMHNSESKIILYAPTHKPNTNDTFLKFIEDSDILLQFLEENDIYLYYRVHYYDEAGRGPDEVSRANYLYNWEDLEKLSNGRIVCNSFNNFPDVSEILSDIDILITDYSSIFFDYLLLDRPIIFLDKDIDIYKKDLGFNFDYYKNTPGPKPNNMKELLDEISKYLKNPDSDKEIRSELKNKFHKYDDGFACERIAKKVLEGLKLGQF